MSKMANRSGSARRPQEIDNTINYVQCDGLVSFQLSQSFKYLDK